MHRAAILHYTASTIPFNLLGSLWAAVYACQHTGGRFTCPLSFPSSPPTTTTSDHVVVTVHEKEGEGEGDVSKLKGR